MSTSSIKISALPVFPVAISGVDYFPLDKSSSVLTYRSSVNQLQSFLSTGSFTGSFTGALTGTASFAYSSSRSITASYIAGNNVSGRLAGGRKGLRKHVKGAGTGPLTRSIHTPG